MSRYTASSLIPYLDMLRTQLATALMPRDENSRKVPLYSHRLITVLLARMRILPDLQQKALDELGNLLDELGAEINSIEGGMILVPKLVHHIRVTRDYAEAEQCLQVAVRLLSHKPCVATYRLQQQIATILDDMQQALNKAVIEQDMKPVTDDAPVESLTAAQTLALRDYLRKKSPADCALEIGPIKKIIGGGSKVTLVIELFNTTNLPAAVVVRIDMANSIVGSTVADEFHLIEIVHEAGLPVPRPYFLETGNDVLDAAFIVVSKVEGRNIGDWFDVTEPSRDFAIGVAQALAKLHKIPLTKAAKLPGATQTTRERVEQEINFYEQTWRASGETSIAMEQGLVWLKSHMPYAEGLRSIIHRDVGCHNMLGKDGELAALLDWETAAVGNPAHDLMYAHVCIVQMMPWEEFLAEYEKAGGAIPSKAELDFYRILVAIFGIHFTFLSRSFTSTGYSDTMVVAYAAERIHLQYERALHNAVRIAFEREE